jgi:formylglycine-generating enzyme required for sulfatase activity
MNMKIYQLVVITFLSLGLLQSCGQESSTATSWEYNNSDNGGFEKVNNYEQETGPGLVFIEGGSFTMGKTEQDVMYDWNNRAARVTVSTFYMDQTEVTNFHWVEYLYWIQRAYGADFPMVYKNALPDTLCWRSPLGFNEKYVDYYLRHPAYRDYPVVGISWLQASDYCKWRTDRVNEYILIREGILEGYNVEATGPTTFNTESYLSGQHEGGASFPDLNPSNTEGVRKVRMEDGFLLPRYRLPTEAEWEFASYGLIGNIDNGQENYTDRKIYPWNGHWVRNDNEEFRGMIRANFARGKGDFMGISGNLNDGHDATSPVDEYWPNDFGLYNMAGNVSEWVMDVYRPLATEDFDEFRPFRGNVFTTKILNNEGAIATKNEQITYDVHGMKEFLNEFERVRYQRISAKSHDISDSVVPDGIMKKNLSRNPVRKGYAPDQFYVSHGNYKDSIELSIIARLNSILDTAIMYKNDKYEYEASNVVQEKIFNGVFAESLRKGPQDTEYDFEVITLLRDGFGSYVLNTPGKLKYRNVTEEENIGRLNYRRDDYIDYLDGDIESSIFYDNNNRKNAINEATRDPNLIMYQSEFEQFDMKGNEIKKGYNAEEEKTTVSWPTTLVSDKSRVFKGGSWKDRAYWLGGGTRRYLDEDKSLSTLGFRCAMDRLGSSKSLESEHRNAKARKKGK